MRLACLFPLVAASMMAAGCSDAVDPTAPMASRPEAIAYGEPDTTNKAVVFLFQEIGSTAATCGGTIVAVKGETGFLLTAAHCVVKYSAPGKMVIPPEPGPLTSMAVVMADNYMVSTAPVKEIFEVAIHPEFDGLSHRRDLAMVRFGKVDPATPVIAAMPPDQDQLQIGDVLDLVGYGATESSKSNTTRRHIQKPIDSLTADYVKFDQSGTSGGACQGDSGGPALTLGSPPWVAGVVSGGTSCTGTSSYGRVSAAYDDFIKPFVDGATGEITCAECFHSSYQNAAPCSAVFRTCFEDQDCTAFGNCLKACGDESSCALGCAQAHAAGEKLYASAMECLCTTACSVECSQDSKCQKPPACGLALAGQGCDECADASCCEEQQACALDKTCHDCAGAASAEPSCAASTLYQDLVRCMGSSCSAACETTSCGYSGRADCQACIESSCCEASLGCSLQDACEACRSAAVPGGECDSLPEWTSWKACVEGTCAKECAPAQAQEAEVESFTVSGGCGVAAGSRTGHWWALSILLIGAMCGRTMRRW